MAIAVLATAAVLAATGVISRQALDYVFLCIVAWTLFEALGKRLGSAVVAALIGIGVAAALAGLQLWAPSLRYMPYLLIAPANLAMALIFARGLMPGRQPVLLALIREIGKGSTDDARFQRFVAGQCALWSILTLVTACLALLAMVSEMLWAWAPDVLGTVILAQVIWFVLSHYYAALRFGRTETWWNTLQAMARPGVWSRLSV
jgi:hypothetical protein